MLAAGARKLENGTVPRRRLIEDKRGWVAMLRACPLKCAA